MLNPSPKQSPDPKPNRCGIKKRLKRIGFLKHLTAENHPKYQGRKETAPLRTDPKRQEKEDGERQDPIFTLPRHQELAKRPGRGFCDASQQQQSRERERERDKPLETQLNSTLKWSWSNPNTLQVL